MKSKISLHPSAMKDLELLRHRRALALAAILDLDSSFGALGFQQDELEKAIEQAKTLLAALKARFAHNRECQESIASGLPGALKAFDAADGAALARGAMPFSEDKLCTAQAEGFDLAGVVNNARALAEDFVEETSATVRVCAAL